MSVLNKLTRFTNRKNCQSFGHLVPPAEKHLYPIESKIHRKKISEKDAQRPVIYSNIDEHIVRVRAVDFYTQTLKKSREITYFYGKRKIVAKRKEPLNIWTTDDDIMVDNIVERLTNGDNTKPPNMPSLGELFKVHLQDMSEEFEPVKKFNGSNSLHSRRSSKDE